MGFAVEEEVEGEVRLRWIWRSEEPVRMCAPEPEEKVRVLIGAVCVEIVWWRVVGRCEVGGDEDMAS